VRLGRIRVVLVTAALVVVALGAACSPEERSAFGSVNTLRSANHLPALEWNEGAYEKAADWSRHMADEGRLSHSNLADGLPAGWRTVGENVAYASSVDSAMQTLASSPPHRANLLNPAFRSVAIGVAVRDGKVWVTEVFIG
jgi:uncharacterized protein YkwD